MGITVKSCMSHRAATQLEHITRFQYHEATIYSTVLKIGQSNFLTGSHWKLGYYSIAG